MIDAERAAGLLGEACERFSVPGAQLGLQRGSERCVALFGSTEVGGSSPVEPTTPFHVGSIVKSLAALVVLDATRRGQLELDVPCSEQAEGLWSDTPRALLSQTTGRPNLLPEVGEDLEPFVARVGLLPRLHPPGRFSYCNAGWSALDLLLRRTTGRTFEDLASDLLGRQLTFGVPAAAAAGHSVGGDGVPRQVPPVFAEAGSAAGTRWWASAGELLDYARLHLAGEPIGALRAADLSEMRRAHAAMPGAAMADAWGLGWALWQRGDHLAFGWFGYTGGHRAFLQCFPNEDATLVLLTNAAGPLLGSSGGSAAFEQLLPDVLELLGVPALPDATRTGPTPAASEVASDYGPITVQAADDGLVIRAEPLGEPEAVVYRSVGGATFAPADGRRGGMAIAFEGDILYLGPMPFAREV